jgi:hypothetical protein
VRLNSIKIATTIYRAAR